jgi:hypothetical protein
MLDRERVTGWKARAFAVAFQRAQRLRACWTQIGLQEPHRRRPSLMVLNRGIGRPVVSYERLPNV